MITRAVRWICSNCGNSNVRKLPQCKKCLQKTHP